LSESTLRGSETYRVHTSVNAARRVRAPHVSQIISLPLDRLGTSGKCLRIRRASEGIPYLLNIRYATNPVATMTNAISEGRVSVTSASAMNQTDTATNSHSV
jgi:hypothetical protein